MNDSMERLEKAIKETGEHVKRQNEILKRLEKLSVGLRLDNEPEPIIGGDGSV